MADGSKEHTLKDRKRRVITTWIFLGLTILFVVFVRVRLLDVPLERDEGEYAYMGQLLLQGIPPYSEAYNMKFPGTYLMYAVIMYLFGQTTQGIHLGFMVLNCATVLLIFFFARKIISDTGAIAASASYAVLSLSSSVLGFAAHATHFVVLPTVAGTILLFNAIEKNKPCNYILSGVMFGLAFIMKQPGLFFFLFGASYIVYNQLSSRPPRPLKETFPRLALLISGLLVPLLSVFIWLYIAGVFDKFWFWTVEYASKYGTRVSVSRAFNMFQESFYSVADGFFILWIISALGLIVIFFHDKLKVYRGFIILLFIFSFLSICPGFYFRQHYFVTLLPAVAVLAGILIDYSETRTVFFFKASYLRYAGLGIFIIAVIVGIIDQKEYLFKDGPVKVSRNFYGPNPFPESVEIAKFIESGSSPSDKIAVLGSEPQICFYSKRHSATGYIYVYGLMEIHEYSLKMQKEMIREIESSRPRFIVFVPVPTSWLMRPESEMYIFNWLNNYLRGYYALVGVADIISPDTTVYKWRADAGQYVIRSQQHVLIFERR